ncbi:MAG: PAS domain S-box protein [Victivallales bacterium]|nr:PAS domain S-box protein [Victivallales bacterium]
MIVVDLVYNLALLVALSVVVGFVGHRWRRSRGAALLQGLIFGSAAVIGMLRPLEMASGVIFDGRSVVISLCGLFFGPLAVGVAGVMAVTCRMIQGGAGAFTGVLVIMSSAGIGLFFHVRHAGRSKEFGTPALYWFAILVHLTMLLLMFTLPGGIALGVIAKIGLPVLLTYPLATILIGKILSDQTARARILTELRARKEEFRTTLYSIGDAVITTDTEGRVRQVNQAAEELMGWTESEARGKPLAEVFRIVNEDTRMPLENPAERALHEGGAVGTANRALLIARDGTERPIADSAGSIRDAHDTVTGAVLVFRDQTAERDAQQVLRRSEQRFRMLFERAPVGIFTTNSQGETLAVNPAMVAILGCASQDEALTHYTDLANQLYLDPDRRAEFVRVLRRDSVVEGFEYEGCAKDGVRKWLSVDARIGQDGEDESFTIEGFTTDITERRRAEAARRASEALLMASQRLSKVGGWEWDVEQKAMSWTDQTYRIHEREPGVFTPGTPEQNARTTGAYRPEDAAKLLGCLQRCVEEGAPYDLEVPFTSAAGRPLWIRTTAEPVRNEAGRVVKVIGNIMDVTERKRGEAERQRLQAQLVQAQRMESVGRLAGGVAHDFNNLLMGIMGYADLCRDEVAPDHPANEWLDAISNGARRSGDLTRQLLAFARKQTIAPEVLDLNGAVSGMLKMLRRFIGEDIKLVWHPDPGLSTVKMDPTQLDQILANLTVNARDAISGVGTVTIDTQNITVDESYCTSHADAIPGDYAMLTVSDDGSGMEKETLANLFEPFFTTKEVGKGSGLGLATVYGIVRQNGGFISVRSELGQGTVFRIHLPAHSLVRVPVVAPKSMGLPPTGTETVLMAEDEALVLDSARRILKGLGYTVLAAPGPAEAIQLAGEYEGDIDLLLTDVVMPEMNGHDLCDRLVGSRPRMKCLYMSGYAADVLSPNGVLEEGVHFIQKPFSRAELATKVREAITDQ